MTASDQPVVTLCSCRGVCVITSNAANKQAFISSCGCRRSCASYDSQRTSFYFFLWLQKGVCQETLAVVPDIISIMDAETAEPIPTEEVRYGQRVAVVILPAPPPMTTPRALQVVGPVPFGYPEVQYTPLGLSLIHISEPTRRS